MLGSKYNLLAGTGIGMRRTREIAYSYCDDKFLQRLNFIPGYERQDWETYKKRPFKRMTADTGPTGICRDT